METKTVDPLAQMLLGSGVSAIFHPVIYTKTLIQLGHEPQPPYATTTIFGRSTFMYPNAYKYLCHIKSVDGLSGLYRGLGARLLGGIASTALSQQVSTRLKELLGPEVKDEDTVDGSTLNDLKQLCKKTSVELVSRCSGIIVSQPFIVVMVRSMAQFVGRETKYDSALSSLLVIWREEGLLGFFSGLIPRLAGEVISVCLVNVLVHVVDKYILTESNKALSPYNSAACTMVITQLTYPFQLVSTIMSVNGSHLEAARRMPAYSSWLDCFCTLSREVQLKRGSSLFWRYYKVPTGSTKID